jgi:hypothetical protein
LSSSINLLILSVGTTSVCRWGINTRPTGTHNEAKDPDKELVDKEPPDKEPVDKEPVDKEPPVLST